MGKWETRELYKTLKFHSCVSADIDMFHQKIKENRAIRVTFIDNDATPSSPKKSFESNNNQQVGECTLICQCFTCSFLDI